MIFHGFMIFRCTLDYLGIFGSLSFPTLETSWSTPPTSTFLPLVCIGQKGVQPKTSPRIFLSHFFLGCQSCQIFLHVSSVFCIFITFIIFKVMKSSWNLPPVRYHPLRLSWHPEGAQPREARPWRAHGEPMGRGAICGNAQKHRGNQRTFQWRNMTNYTRLSMTTIWLLCMAIWLSLISLISLISLLSLLSLCAVLIEMGKTGIFHRMNHERVQKIDWCKKTNC